MTQQPIENVSEFLKNSTEKPIDAQQKVLYDVNGIVQLSNGIFGLKYPFNPLDPTSRFNLNVISAWLARMDGFLTVYYDYSLFFNEMDVTFTAFPSIRYLTPEEDVNEETRARAKNQLKSDLFRGLLGDLPANAQTSHNPQETYMVCLFIVLCSTKKFTNEQQLLEYLKNRFSAFAWHMYSTSHMTFEDLSFEHFIAKHQPSYFNNLQHHMSLYPKFKQMMYSWVIGSNAPWADYAKKILKYAQLALFNLTYLYLKDEIPSKALFFPQIQKEISAFRLAYIAAVDKYGETLPYAKLLYPDDPLLASNPWSTLSTMAVYRASFRTAADSLAKLKTRPIKAEYLFELDFGVLTLNAEDCAFINVNPTILTTEVADRFMEIDQFERQILQDYANQLKTNQRLGNSLLDAMATRVKTKYLSEAKAASITLTAEDCIFMNINPAFLTADPADRFMEIDQELLRRLEDFDK